MTAQKQENKRGRRIRKKVWLFEFGFGISPVVFGYLCQIFIIGEVHSYLVPIVLAIFNRCFIDFLWSGNDIKRLRCSGKLAIVMAGLLSGLGFSLVYMAIMEAVVVGLSAEYSWLMTSLWLGLGPEVWLI